MTRKGKAKGKQQASQANAGTLLVSIEAAADFFVGVQHVDSGLKSTPQDAGKHSCELEAWRTRDKLLAWFDKGAAADSSAKLTFCPSLSKQQRQDLHRRCTDGTLSHLQSKAIGLGDARCIVIAHSAADLGAEDVSLSSEQATSADALYRDLQAAGESISRDEVRTRVALGELTDKMQRLLKQTKDDQASLQKVIAAINDGTESKLQDVLATSKRAIRSGVPARGSGVLPLQLAIEKGQESAVRALLEAGAPLEEADGKGRTPLQVARKTEQCDIEGLLLQRGAKDSEKEGWGADAAQFSATKDASKTEHASAAVAAAAAKMERPGAPQLPSGGSTPRAGRKGSAFSEQHGGKQAGASSSGALPDHVKPANMSVDTAAPFSADAAEFVPKNGISKAPSSLGAAAEPAAEQADSLVKPGATFADALKTGDAEKVAAEKEDDDAVATNGKSTEASLGAADKTEPGAAAPPKDSTIVPGATFADAVATGDAQKAAEFPPVSAAAEQEPNIPPPEADPEEFPTVTEAMAADESDGPEESGAPTDIAQPEQEQELQSDSTTPAEPPSYAAIAAQPPSDDSAVVEGVKPTAAPVEFSAGRNPSLGATASTPDTAPSPESAMAKEPLPHESDPTPAVSESKAQRSAGAATPEIQPVDASVSKKSTGTRPQDARVASNGAGEAESVPAVLQQLAEEYYNKACTLCDQHSLLVVSGVAAAVGLLAFGAAFAKRR